MATRHLFTKNGFTHFKITLDGSKLTTNETIQEFDSDEAALEHFERILKIRKKDGYTVTVEDADADKSLGESDGSGGEADETADYRIASEAGGKRMTITFLGSPGDATPAICAKLLDRIDAKSPASLHLLCDFKKPGNAWATSILAHKKKTAGKGLASIKTLIFDTHFQTQTRQGENSIGDLTSTLESLPNVERVFATGDLKMTPCTHNSLQDLFLLGDPLKAKLFDGLRESKLPKLERLVLSLASDAGPVDEGARIVKMIGGLNAPKLHTLHVDSLGSLSDVIGLFAKQLPKSLKVLSLGGDIDDEDEFLAALTKHGKAFAQLSELRLPLEDSMSSDGQSAASELVKGIGDIDNDLTLPAIYTDW